MTTYAKGFIPFRNVGASLGGSTRRYPTRGKNAKQIFRHDAVVAASCTAGIFVTPYAAATDATVAAGVPLGVVESVYDSSGKPFTFSQPTHGPYISTSAVGFVDVIIDPNQTYAVCVNGTASADMFGKFVSIDTTAAGTAAGISPMSVGVATTINALRIPVTADQTPFSGTWPLYCIGPVNFDSAVDNDILAASYKGADGDYVEVKFTSLATNSVGGNVRTRTTT